MTFHCRACHAEMSPAEPDGSAFCGYFCAEGYSAKNTACAWCGLHGAKHQGTIGDADRFVLLFCGPACVANARSHRESHAASAWWRTDPTRSAGAGVCSRNGCNCQEHFDNEYKGAPIREHTHPACGCRPTCTDCFLCTCDLADPVIPDGASTDSDPVDRPAHYVFGAIQPLDAIEAWGLGHHEASVVKYIVRARHKGAELEDLEKAATYLRRKIKLLKASE